MKMTKETILKEDGRLLVYYRFDRASGDVEKPQAEYGDAKPSDEGPYVPSAPSA